MRPNTRQRRYLVSGTAFLIAYLLFDIFGGSVWQFVTGAVHQWWHRDGPGGLFGAGVGVAAFLLFQKLAFDTDWEERRARKADRRRQDRAA